MEWSVIWRGETIRVKLPQTLVAGEKMTAILANGRSVHFLWDDRLKTLVLYEGAEGLERCFGVRSKRLQKFPAEASCELELEVTGCLSSSLKAKISPLARGEAGRQARQEVKGTLIRSPMTGKVLQLMAKQGEQVSAGAVLLVIEAMKMENQIFAPQGGEVCDLKVQAGDLVQVGAILARIQN